MSRTSSSLSTLNAEDSETSQKIFEALYLTLERLKEDTTKIRDNLKSCKKRIQTADLSERLMDPKPHALAYFQKNSIPNPCTLEEFMTTLFGKIAKERRLCHRTRSLYLNEEEAKLFGLLPMNA